MWTRMVMEEGCLFFSPLRCSVKPTQPSRPSESSWTVQIREPAQSESHCHRGFTSPRCSFRYEHHWIIITINQQLKDEDFLLWEFDKTETTHIIAGVLQRITAVFRHSFHIWLHTHGQGPESAEVPGGSTSDLSTKTHHGRLHCCLSAGTTDYPESGKHYSKYQHPFPLKLPKDRTLLIRR